MSVISKKMREETKRNIIEQKNEKFQTNKQNQVGTYYIDHGY